jgi:FAD binding domain
MASQVLSANAVTALLVLIPVSMLIIGYLRRSKSQRNTKVSDELGHGTTPPKPNKLTQLLASALPESVILPQNSASFKKSMNSYWAQQECEIVPACVVRPRNTVDLCTAVRILKQEFDERKRKGGQRKEEGLFAVRGGGHSAVSGAASIKGGVVVDMSLLSEVTPSEDEASVVIGAGCKWADVSKVLDERGLAVAGGRNSAVGVGGLTLGGELVLSTLLFQNPLTQNKNRRSLFLLTSLRYGLLKHH